jgi:hypothetical protein
VSDPRVVTYICSSCRRRKTRRRSTAAVQPEDETEIWSDVAGFEGAYQVSSLGRVRSLDRIAQSKDGRSRRLKGKVLSANPATTGYPSCSLSLAGLVQVVAVHRIVCEAFHGQPSTRRNEVGHRDGDRTNNRADNLRWVSPHENRQDMMSHGTWNRGDRSRAAKLNDTAVRQIRADTQSTNAALARQFGVSASVISSVRRHLKWKHVV